MYSMSMVYLIISLNGKRLISVVRGPPPHTKKNLHSKLIQGEQIDAVGGRVTTYRMELATRVQTLANTNAFLEKA